MTRNCARESRRKIQPSDQHCRQQTSDPAEQGDELNAPDHAEHFLPEIYEKHETWLKTDYTYMPAFSQQSTQFHEIYIFCTSRASLRTPESILNQ